MRIHTASKVLGWAAVAAGMAALARAFGNHRIHHAYLGGKPSPLHHGPFRPNRQVRSGVLPSVVPVNSREIGVFRFWNNNVPASSAPTISHGLIAPNSMRRLWIPANTRCTACAGPRPASSTRRLAQWPTSPRTWVLPTGYGFGRPARFLRTPRSVRAGQGFPHPPARHLQLRGPCQVGHGRYVPSHPLG